MAVKAFVGGTSEGLSPVGLPRPDRRWFGLTTAAAGSARGVKPGPRRDCVGQRSLPFRTAVSGSLSVLATLCLVCLAAFRWSPRPTHHRCPEAVTNKAPPARRARRVRIPALVAYPGAVLLSEFLTAQMSPPRSVAWLLSLRPVDTAVS